jgi:hypothetical protein
MYEDGSIRSTLHSILKYPMYQGLKDKTIVLYLIFAFVGQTLGKNS